MQAESHQKTDNGRAGLAQLHSINTPLDILVDALMVIVAEENSSPWAVFEASRALQETGPDARVLSSYLLRRADRVHQFLMEKSAGQNRQKSL
jgi:hypothetical protein